MTSPVDRCIAPGTQRLGNFTAKSQIAASDGARGV